MSRASSRRQVAVPCRASNNNKRQQGSGRRGPSRSGCLPAGGLATRHTNSRWRGIGAALVSFVSWLCFFGGSAKSHGIWYPYVMGMPSVAPWSCSWGGEREGGRERESGVERKREPTTTTDDKKVRPDDDDGRQTERQRRAERRRRGGGGNGRNGRQALRECGWDQIRWNGLSSCAPPVPLEQRALLALARARRWNRHQ